MLQDGEVWKLAAISIPPTHRHERQACLSDEAGR